MRRPAWMTWMLIGVFAAACSSSEGGAGGAGGKACPVCAGLDEQACIANESGVAACKPIYGEPLSAPGTTAYAGCANMCTSMGNHLGATCGRPPQGTGQCFKFVDGLLPEGWIEHFDTCAGAPECVVPP